MIEHRVGVFFQFVSYIQMQDIICNDGKNHHQDRDLIFTKYLVILQTLPNPKMFTNTPSALGMRDAE